jgi:excisionase family DNA binding protein
MEMVFTTTQAAAQLGISDATVRGLCKSGAIHATRTSGGHWRIAKDELERVKALPSIPRVTANSDSAHAVRKNAHELLGPPSAPAIEIAETAYVSGRELAADTNRLARLKIHKDATELVDYFSERRARQEAKEREQERIEQEQADKEWRRRRQQLEEQQRKRFNSCWLAYAVDQRRWDSPDDYAARIQGDVVTVLNKTEVDQDDDTVKSLVDAAIARALTPWREDQRRRQEKHDALESAIADLPIWLRHDRAWESRARHIAGEAIDGARDSATPSQMAAAATLALRPLVAEFEHQQKIEAVLQYTIYDGDGEEREQAAEALREALGELPIGASDRDIEKTKTAVLAPFRRQVALRDGKEALVMAGLLEIFPHARRLIENFDYDSRESPFDVQLRTAGKVEEILRRELKGDETPDYVRDRVGEIMEELEQCEVDKDE